MADNRGADKNSDKQNNAKSSFNPNQHQGQSQNQNLHSVDEKNHPDSSDQGQNQGNPGSVTSAEDEKIEELKALAEKNLKDFLYLRADFENYKKHAIKERSEYLKYGSERLIVDLLGVLDNFERALETKITQENFANFVKGVEMTGQEFRTVLQKFGVNEIAAQGKAFDPTLHEALGSEESKEVEPGNILRVFKKPYKLHEKMIRPGQVIVAKQSPQ